MDKMYVIVNEDRKFRNKHYKIDWTDDLNKAKLYTLEDAKDSIKFIKDWSDCKVFRVNIILELGDAVND